MPKDRLAYSLKEAAALIGVSRTFFYRMRKLGQIPVCDDGRICRVKHDDLMAYLNTHRKIEPNVIVPQS